MNNTFKHHLTPPYRHTAETEFRPEGCVPKASLWERGGLGRWGWRGRRRPASRNTI